VSNRGHCEYWFSDCGMRILRVIHGRDARATFQTDPPAVIGSYCVHPEGVQARAEVRM